MDIYHKETNHLKLDLTSSSIENMKENLYNYNGVRIYNENVDMQVVYTIQKIQEMRKNNNKFTFNVIPLDPYLLFKIWYLKKYNLMKQDNFLFLPTGKGIKFILNSFPYPILQYISLEVYLLNTIRILNTNGEIIIFIGNNQKQLDKLSYNFKKAFPNQKILYKYYDKDSEHNQNNLLQLILKIKPKVVFLNLGRKKEISWIMKNYKNINKSIGIIALNGSLKFLSGLNQEVLQFFLKRNLLWFWESIINPFMWYRLLIVFFLFSQSILKRFSKKSK